MLKVLENNKTTLSPSRSHAPLTTQEDYALSIFDIQVLYLPSFNFLEAIEYNEVSKEETEKRYSLLKRTDLQLDFSKVSIINSNLTP